jgi:hypothetical protein
MALSQKVGWTTWRFSRANRYNRLILPPALDSCPSRMIFDYTQAVFSGVKVNGASVVAGRQVGINLFRGLRYSSLMLSVFRPQTVP